jgi:hypothetical protein
MALTKVTKGGITDDAVDGDKLKDGSITTAKIGASAVESSEINDGTVTVDDLASSLDISSKTVTLPNTSVTVGMLSNTLDLSSKTVTLSNTTIENLKRPVQDNIALLGFKMAVNDGLTVFNLVDGVVDEFNDESGTDEAEGTNDYYCGTSDFYRNAAPLSYSAGFASTTVTEPDTSTAGVSPGTGFYTQGSFTVPTGITSIDFKIWGAGAGAYPTPSGPNPGFGGGGGFTSGTLAVTPTQVLYTGGSLGGTGTGGGFGQDDLGCSGIRGGHLVSLNSTPLSITSSPAETTAPAPSIFAVAGSGGGGSYGGSSGGAGGGTTGDAGGTQTEQTNLSGQGAGGGDQEQGGQAGNAPVLGPGQSNGSFLEGGSGGNSNSGNGGAGYYGGGGGGAGGGADGAGGGGSSYYGHPQITSGSNEEGGSPANQSGGGTTDPAYVPGTNEGSASKTPGNSGEPGYVLLTATGVGSTTSTTIISTAFTSTTVPTSSRIVVFEENVDTPTLNTDIIASISRDGGSTFTNATLSDSGYVTGSSGQRILTGTATISGQPSGQSMRWKLALANNTVKIHGVALQWS